MRNITDIPISCKDDDKLEIDDYQNALLLYIKESETPMTISIQGEWGSGKTSLMNMIKTNLEEDDIPMLWINTWEYSMLGEDFAALSVFDSIIKELIGFISQNSPKKIEKYKEEISSVLNKAAFIAKGAGKLFLSMNLDVNSNSAVDDIAKSLSGAASVSKLKNELQKLVDRIFEIKEQHQNPNRKIIIFVDDLDRLNPEVSIKILEILKNIFDLKHCLFVLAIDYEVIVKGLNAKFGDRKVNEREYRQFFDKIIQLPFSLPVGRYNSEKYIQDMIAGDKIEYFTPDEFNTYKDYLMKVVNYSVGGNPRALKRMANYLSLVNSLLSKSTTEERLVHFTLIAIQIVYPFVYKLLAMEPNFKSWKKATFNFSIVDLPKEFEGKKEFDEDWEIELYKAIHATDSTYFLERSFDISNLLNQIIVQFTEENYGDLIQSALEVASITNAEIPNNNANNPNISYYWKEIKKLEDDIHERQSRVQTIKLNNNWVMRITLNQKSSRIGIHRNMQNGDKWISVRNNALELADNVDVPSEEYKKMDKSIYFNNNDCGFEKNFEDTKQFIVDKYKVLKDFTDKNL